MDYTQFHRISARKDQALVAVDRSSTVPRNSLTHSGKSLEVQTQLVAAALLFVRHGARARSTILGGRFLIPLTRALDYVFSLAWADDSPVVQNVRNHKIR